MSDEPEPGSDASADAAVDVGDRYRLTDDGTVFEVVGVTDEGVDVVQYDDAGDPTGEYTTTVEEFRRDVVDPAR